MDLAFAREYCEPRRHYSEMVADRLDDDDAVDVVLEVLVDYAVERG